MGQTVKIDAFTSTIFFPLFFCPFVSQQARICTGGLGYLEHFFLGRHVLFSFPLFLVSGLVEA